jgi:hypothetical protein
MLTLGAASRQRVGAQPFQAVSPVYSTQYEEIRQRANSPVALPNTHHQ